MGMHAHMEKHHAEMNAPQDEFLVNQPFIQMGTYFQPPPICLFYNQ